MKKLTGKQKDILDYIKSNMRYVPPTLAEMSGHFNIHPSAIRCHIEAIARKGYLKRISKSKRELSILDNTEIGV